MSDEPVLGIDRDKSGNWYWTAPMKSNVDIEATIHKIVALTHERERREAERVRHAHFLMLINGLSGRQGPYRRLWFYEPWCVKCNRSRMRKERAFMLWRCTRCRATLTAFQMRGDYGTPRRGAS